ncbi:DUF1573 domain-containing protein [Rasiella sp. SM2506]|uniref:DUF1573 domain-containing protein n=1 Tax=Rasiella sp. SM2506 TaxID=3423914 RepID=UPI003D7AFB9C
MKYFLLLFMMVSFTHMSNAQIVGTWKAKITFENPSVDLGVIKKGTMEEVTLPFINDGTEPLVIKGYKSSSKAIVITFPKEPIKPGEKSKIILKYNAGTAGDIKEKIRLATNAQKKPILLNVSGVVK